MNKKSRVAIIGAGVSGLAAAVMLRASADVEVTLFEARREPGGRTRSYVDPTTGDELDNGQHLLAGCYTSTLEYLRRIGSEDLLDRSRTLSVEYWRHGSRSTFTLPNLLSPADLVLGLLATDLLSSREKLAAMRLGNAVRRGHSVAAQMTTRELMLAYTQPDGVIKKLWEPIVLATMNVSVDRGSALLFVNVLKELFFGAARGSALLFPRVGLTKLLITPAVRFIGSEHIRCGEPVRTMTTAADRVHIATDTGDESFDYVITTDLSLEGSAPLEYSPIVNAYLWLDRPVLASPIAGFLGTTVQWAFPKRSAWSAQLLALTVSAADELVLETNDAIVARLWSDLQETLPEARSAKVLHAQIIKEKRATALLSPDAQAMRPAVETESERVFLAGDYVQNELPCTIEGAIRNGFRAAELVAEKLRVVAKMSHAS